MSLVNDNIDYYKFFVESPYKDKREKFFRWLYGFFYETRRDDNVSDVYNYNFSQNKSMEIINFYEKQTDFTKVINELYEILDFKRLYDIDLQADKIKNFHDFLTVFIWNVLYHFQDNMPESDMAFLWEIIPFMEKEASGVDPNEEKEE